MQPVLYNHTVIIKAENEKFAQTVGKWIGISILHFQESLPASVQQYKEATGNDVSISIDTDNFLGNDV